MTATRALLLAAVALLAGLAGALAGAAATPPSSAATSPPSGAAATPPSSATTSPPSGAALADREAIRRPPPNPTWQWQLDGRLDLSVPADLYDVDGFETSAATVRRLHADGRYVVCYLSAGTSEAWRPDDHRIPRSVRGKGLGWPGERWLDVRRLDVLAPVLRARIAMCARKGFDAVEPDNVDGFSNDTGFSLTARDQLRFNRWLARTAHRHGLAIALKNDLEQAPQLAGLFDFAILEQCFQYRECAAARPFLRRGKPVLDAEYAVPIARFCAQADALGISAIRKRLDLTAWRQTC